MNKATYIGNCTDSFSPTTGSCRLSVFTDVSDFALADEEAVDLEQDDFLAVVDLGLDRPWESHQVKYLFDERTGVFMVYDEDEDIHYFFAVGTGV